MPAFIATADANGNVTRFQYDQNRRVVATTAPATPAATASATTTLTYTPDGQVARSEQSVGGTVLSAASTTYTRTGKVATSTDPNGNVTRYAYDALDRVAAVIDPVGRTTTFAYDAVGRRTGLSNLALQSAPLVQQTWTANGRPASLVVARGNAVFNTTNYTYDGFDRLATTTYPGGSTEVLTYDPGGNVLTRKTRANQTLTYTYDTLNRIATKSGPSLPTVTYGYDLMDRLTGVTDNGATLVAALPPSGGTVRFATTMTYDALNRPLGAAFDPAPAPAVPPAQASVAFGHRYSAGDQRIGQSASDSSWLYYPPVSAGTTGYTANNLDQYTAVAAVTPTYDGNGNLTFDGTYTYAYDAESRLLTASQGSTNVGTYDWDAQGRRKQKSAGGGKFVYVTDADNREVLAYNGASGQLQRWTAFGPGPNDVLSVLNVGGARTTLVPDIQGSMIASLDSGTGALTKTNYLPFGQSATTSGAFRYTGQRIDGETGGLYYYRARMYAPRLGRFLQADPIGTDGGPNLYAYVGNDPLNQADPSGLVAEVGAGGVPTSYAPSLPIASLNVPASSMPLEQLAAQVNAQYAARDPYSRRGEPFPSGGGGGAGTPPARGTGNLQDALSPSGQLIGNVTRGAGANIRTLEPPAFIKLQDNLTSAARPVTPPGSYPGRAYELPDGSIVGIRSSSTGPVLDVIKSTSPSIPNGFKVHQR